jgi:molybdate-binding protein/DNA-binding transcriptional regulator YhcF (GntR family)
MIMDGEYLYLQIAASIRRDIASGMYKSGDALPSIRRMTETWHCTIGTIQRAFQKLASEGLISIHVGKRTTVNGSIPVQKTDSLRRANLIHRSETFLLEMLTSGFTPVEAEDAFRIALDRWRTISQSQQLNNQNTLRFAGSHDLAVAWLATHFEEVCPGYELNLNFSGSIAGLMSLMEGKSDLAGAHLLDDETGIYNIPFLHSLFPGEKLALTTLAHRRIGFIVKLGNPKNVRKIEDLAREDITFVNRLAGSGTRVYLDSLLRKKGIKTDQIMGYENQKNTHSEVAAEVARGRTDVGIGLEAAAIAYHLDFIFLTLERYDFVTKARIFEKESFQNIITWLKGEPFRLLLERLGGYEHQESGAIHWT